MKALCSIQFKSVGRFPNEIIIVFLHKTVITAPRSRIQIGGSGAITLWSRIWFSIFEFTVLIFHIFLTANSPQINSDATRLRVQFGDEIIPDETRLATISCIAQRFEFDHRTDCSFPTKVASSILQRTSSCRHSSRRPMEHLQSVDFKLLYLFFCELTNQRYPSFPR